jgi:hypothetical protein
MRGVVGLRNCQVRVREHNAWADTDQRALGSLATNVNLVLMTSRHR